MCESSLEKENKKYLFTEKKQFQIRLTGMNKYDSERILQKKNEKNDIHVLHESTL